MPTTRKRHSVTETPPVQAALDRLRIRGIPIELGDLLVRGARDRLAEEDHGILDEDRRHERRQRFLARSSSADGVDVVAALEVHEHGWLPQ